MIFAGEYMCSNYKLAQILHVYILRQTNEHYTTCSAVHLNRGVHLGSCIAQVERISSLHFILSAIFCNLATATSTATATATATQSRAGR